MANTLSASLLNDIILEETQVALQDKLAMWGAFSTNFSADMVQVPRAGQGPTSSIVIPFQTAASTTLTNPASFEAGDGTLTVKTLAASHYSQPFHITQVHRNSGYKIENLVRLNAHTLANKLNDVAMALVTVATYGAATVTSSAANFDETDLALLWAALEKADTKNVVLTGAYYAKFLPSDLRSFVPGQSSGAYGWAGFYHTSRMVADTNVVGFACAPTAMGIASCLPALDEEFSRVIDQMTIPIPGLDGFAVQFNKWLSVASRTQWASFDVVFGAGVIDTSALKILTSA